MIRPRSVPPRPIVPPPDQPLAINGRRMAYFNLGNLAQPIGAGVICWGVYRISNIGIALLVTGVVVVALANLEWDASVWRIPMPRRPHPIVKISAVTLRVRRVRLPHPRVHVRRPRTTRLVYWAVCWKLARKGVWPW